MPPAYVARAGIFKESMGARNRGGIHSIESIPGPHKHLKILSLEEKPLVGESAVSTTPAIRESCLY